MALLRSTGCMSIHCMGFAEEEQLPCLPPQHMGTFSRCMHADVQGR